MKIKSFVLLMILFAVAGLSLKLAPDSNAQIKPPATPTPPAAQTPKPIPSPQKEKDDDEVIRVNTELVTLSATVTDKNGRYRADLKRGDFTRCGIPAASGGLKI